MKRGIIFFTAVLFFLRLCSSLWALPRTADEAEMVVAGWLKADPQPLDTALGHQVMEVETFTDDYGEPVYYIVYLQPSGFVIVSADDLVEPIIGFADDGAYDPSLENPLGALVTKDLNVRIAAVRSTFSPLAMPPQAEVTETQKKWHYFISLAETSKDKFVLMVLPLIYGDHLSDIRVAPLVQSKWGQRWYYDYDNKRQACYNYFTPQLVDNKVSFIEGREDNYPCGCVATFMAQLMRYHRYPNKPVEPNKFTISIDEQMTECWLLRGEGLNGAYNWNDIVLEPGGDTTDKQRRAIGALCHDAGVSTNMHYAEGGSGTTMYKAAEALKSTFKYHSAILGQNSDINMSSGLIGMINPNLDAECPVVFAIGDVSDPDRGHAILCDGYGYESSQLYHHLNMGWDGLYDCWYNLPIIYCPNADLSGIVAVCIYNIYTDDTGEIISGRVLDGKGRPIRDAVVTAKSAKGGGPYTAVTNSKGIYALTYLDSDSMYSITVNKLGYDFVLNDVDTGISSDGDSVSGNKWGVNFTGYSNCLNIAIGTGKSDWSYPLNADYHSSRTQIIYLASEIGGSGTILELALDVTKAIEQMMESWTIRMKHTSMSEYTDNCSLDADGWTVVYRNNESVMNDGWHNFVLQTPFEYNGRDNLLVDFSHNNSSYTGSGQCRVSCPGGKRSVYAYSDSRYEDPLDWPTSGSPTVRCSNNILNVKLAFGRESQVICEDIKLTASDGKARDRFGFSVSISGDYSIVGAPGSGADEYHPDPVYGSAYIFKCEGTSWTQQAKLTHPQGHAEYSFGDSVSISGDYAIVDAEEDKQHHSIFIFKREGTSWTQQVESNYRSNYPDYTRPSVSISRDYAIGGIWSSAYIFERVGTSWAQQAELFRPDMGNYEGFGDSVSISGDYAIVATRPLFGLVYIFKREGESWTQQAELTSLDGSTEDSFGSSVSIEGDYAIVGAESDGGNGENSGAAYIFKRSGTTWSEQAKLIASDGTDWALFGNSVSINGDYAVIGAKGNNENGTNSGAAYIFEREGASWVQKAKLTAWDGGSQDYFGLSVSISGDYVIVGAPYDDENGYNSGSVYIFKRGCVSWTK